MSVCACAQVDLGLDREEPTFTAHRVQEDGMIGNTLVSLFLHQVSVSQSRSVSVRVRGIKWVRDRQKMASQLTRA